MKRSDNYLINDIKESIKSIEEYLSELNYNKENFLSNRRMQKLMIYEIIMIG